MLLSNFSAMVATAYDATPTRERGRGNGAIIKEGLAMAEMQCEENVFSIEEWNQLMQEISRADRQWTVWSDEEDALAASDFDCLPSEQ